MVIPAFNEDQYLAKNLLSVINQEFQNFELIVVNNNSADRTAEIAECFGAKVIFEPRQGVGFARQAGFLEAKGKRNLLAACMNCEIITFGELTQ